MVAGEAVVASSVSAASEGSFRGSSNIMRLLTTNVQAGMRFCLFCLFWSQRDLEIIF